MSIRLWRVFGGLALGSIVLLFAAISVEGMTPELGSKPSEFAKALMHGSLITRFAGGYAEALSTLVFLAAALLLARLLRGSTELTGWLASLMSATAIINVGSSLIVGFPAGAAAIYDGHHGATLQTVTTMDDLRNFAFFLSITDLGVFTACAGAAILATRILPRWLGWAGVGVGLLCVVAVAGARAGSHDIADMVQMVWWVLLAVAALRVSAATAVPPVREPLTV